MHFLPVLLAAFSKCPISYCSALDSCLDPASQPAALLHLEMKNENSFKIELLSIPYCDMCEKYHFIDKLVNFTGCFWTRYVSRPCSSLVVVLFQSTNCRSTSLYHLSASNYPGPLDFQYILKNEWFYAMQTYLL